MPECTQLLIIGGGMAAARLTQELDRKCFPGSVTIVCAEQDMGYNRVLLPGYIGGKYQPADLQPAQQPWRTNPNVRLLKSVAVTGINIEDRVATLHDGSCIHFSVLVFATGSLVPKPDIPGIDSPVATELRSLADADHLRSRASRATHAVVVGGGLLGLEAADGLHKLGLGVRLIHRGPRLLTRQLDEQGATLLSQELLSKGIDVSLSTTVTAIQPRAEADVLSGADAIVRLSNGKHHPADIVVFATGAQPNDRLARQAGLRCDQGILTDEYLRTSAAKVFALGECARVRGQHHQLVEPINAQASALANTLTGELTAADEPASSTRLKMEQIALFTAGQIRPEAGDDITICDPRQGLYRRLLLDRATLVGAILLGDTTSSRQILSSIGTRPGAAELERLAFGIQ